MTRFTRRMLPVATLAALALFSAGAFAEQRTAAEPVSTPRGLPQDWSQLHVVYRNPDTPQQAAAKGRTQQWRRSYRDPRFVLALMRKLDAQASTPAGAGHRASSRRPGPTTPPPTESGMHRDWSNVLGGGTNGNGGVGSAGVYPAKYSFDISAAPSCANDFVVYSTGTVGSTAVLGSFEGLNSAFTSNLASVGTITIGTPGTARIVTLTASTTQNTGLFFQSVAPATNVSNATNLAAAVNRWSGTTGITASLLPSVPGGGVRFFRNTPSDTVTIPVTEALSNYATGTVVNGTGTAGQPTIVAFNQLYNTTCNATRTNPAYPNVFWSYNTGTGATVRTSPVISYYDNGLQVAFVQSSAGQAQLVLLKWSSAAAGTAGSPTAPASVTLANYRACTAPCMTVMSFSGVTDDSFSSPYVDYFGDAVWVGANNGTLHKFTGVFSGTPAEVTSGGFPATVSSGNALSSPVYDFGTGQVFVGSARGAASGGMLHRVNGLTGAVTNSGQLAINSSTGLRASPILDSSAGSAYAWVFDDGVNGDGVTCNAAAPCQSVYQFSTAFAGGTSGSKARVGSGSGGLNAVMFNGTFDDAYYSNAVPTGGLYACGSLPNDSTTAVLWKIPIVNNVMGTPVQGASVTSTGFVGNCSPVTEIKNGTHDYLYVGLPDHATDGAATVCGTGAAADACLYMFDLSSLNGAVAANETWVYTFSGGGAQAGDVITLNGTVLTGTAVNNSAAPPYTFRSQGSANNDGDDLTTVASALSGTTGISVSTTALSGVVTFTNVATGDVPDNKIVNGLSNFALTSHTDGSVPGPNWAKVNVPSAGLIVLGGTSGMVMDNISSTTGTSQVYFSSLGSDCDAVTAGNQSCGNAYQASQAGLQ